MRNKLSKYLRIREWWSHILPPIMLFYYLGLTSNTALKESLLPTYISIIIMSILIAITGYYINDLFDISEDKKVNKYNFSATIPILFRYLFLLFLFLLCILFNYFISFYISKHALKIIQIFTGTNLFLFLIYSVPPVRLKSNKYGALILDALYSGTLFYIMAFLLSVSEYKKYLFVLCLIFSWGVLKGIRNYLNHITENAEKDIISGQITLVSTINKSRIQIFSNMIYPLETILLTFLLSLSAPKIIIYILLIGTFFLIVWWQHIKTNRHIRLPFLNDLYEIWYPFLILIFLIFSHPDLYLLLIIHTVLFSAYLNKLYYYTIFRLVGPIRTKNE